MKKFIVLICFFSIVGIAFALPLTYSTSPSSPTSISSNKVLYTGQVEHLFTHCLLAYPALALSEENPMQSDYDRDCITPNEFKALLKELYENNYALIDINKLFEEKDGKVVKATLEVPEGKKPLKVALYRASIPSIIFEGYEDRSKAALLTGRTVYFDRRDVVLPEGTVFNDDLIGLPVFDYESGARIGTLTDVEEAPRGYRYVISAGEKRYCVPAVDEFVRRVSVEDGVFVTLIDGLEL